MAQPNQNDPLVSVEWLRENLARVRMVDGTWSMPSSEAAHPTGFIKGAVVFDIDAVADSDSEMAHMRPSAQTFATAVSNMGIRAEDTVVIYDGHGVFSAPRVWWTFKLFGHANVYVLDGGLPAWIAAGHSTAAQPQTYTKSEYKASPDNKASGLAKAVDIEDVLRAIESGAQIIDARPPGRFGGTAPEPRANLRGGHMPGASNVPFGSLQTADSHFKPLAEIAERFGCVDLSAPIITTCGSGITAAGLAFSLARLGAADVRVYDGSWAEYGARKDVPISCA